MDKIHAIHKSIFNDMKKRAKEIEGPISKDLGHYRKNQKSFASRPFEKSNFTQLKTAIFQSSIVYIGDFHTFDQNSKTLERLLRVLEGHQREILIGVEVVNIKHQKVINQYLFGHITELEFLEMIEYHNSWRFPWKHYKVFFDLAKNKSLKIIALNSKGNLSQRDKEAASIIAKAHKKYSNALILVLFGEYHITPNKLPKLVKQKTSPALKDVIIHQNLDEVYFSNKFDSNIIKFNNSEFSLLTSPPWIKYESMIYWYENICEDPEFEIHEYMNETGHLNFNSTASENFLFVCKKAINAFQLQITNEVLEDFNIYDYQKFDYVLEKIELLPSPLPGFYKKLIKLGRTFRFPTSNSFYCGGYSLNKISHLAGMHLYNIILRSQDDQYDSILINKSSRRSEVFLIFLYQSMSGYLTTKLINPYKKCSLYMDLIEAIEKNDYQIGKTEDITLVVNIIDTPKRINTLLNGKNLSSLFNTARLLAYFLAEHIFDNSSTHTHIHIHIHTDRRDQIFSIIYKSDFSIESFQCLYSLILKNIDYKKSKKRLF